MGALDWGFPVLAGFFWLAIVLAVVWEGVWKGIALWQAGRNGLLVWFIGIFIFRTLAILPIVYLFAVSCKQSLTSSAETGDRM